MSAGVLAGCEPENPRPDTSGDGNHDGSPAPSPPKFSGPEQQSEVQIKWQWRVGSELPPFTCDNAAAVQLMLDLAQGSGTYIPSIFLSKAVAVQVVLMFESTAMRHLPFKLIYRLPCHCGVCARCAALTPARRRI